MVIIKSKNGKTWYWSPDETNAKVDTIKIHLGLFPCNRYLTANLTSNGIIGKIDDTLSVDGVLWKIINVSKIEDESSVRTYLTCMALPDYLMSMPSQKAANLDKIVESAGLYWNPNSGDNDFPSMQSLCGPGRTIREMLYDAIYQHRAECTIDLSTCEININNPGQSASGDSKSRIFVTSDVTSAIVTLDNGRTLTTATFMGTGIIQPGYIFGSGSPDVVRSLKCIACSRTGDPGYVGLIMVVAVEPDRFVDVDTLCHVGLTGSPCMNEIREWRNSVIQSRSYIARASDRHGIIFNGNNWLNGEEIPSFDSKGNEVIFPKLEKTNPTSKMLVYHQQDGKEQWYCKFPDVRTSDASDRNELLITMPGVAIGRIPFGDSTTISRTDIVKYGKSIDTGTVIDFEQFKKIGTRENLEFKLRSTGDPKKYGIFKWDAVSNSWIMQCYSNSDTPSSKAVFRTDLINLKHEDCEISIGSAHPDRIKISVIGGTTVQKITIGASSLRLEGGGRVITMSNGTVDVT